MTIESMGYVIGGILAIIGWMLTHDKLKFKQNGDNILTEFNF